MKRIIPITIVFALLLFGTSFAARYKVVEVKNGGSIKGKVKTSVKVKDPVVPIKLSSKEKPEDAKKIRETCGDSQKANMYLISSAGEVKNVLVIVENVKEGKAAPKKDFVLDNNRCRFEPLVGIAYVKSNYIVKNSDPILHNTSLGKMVRKGVRRTVYNLALPHKDQVIKKKDRVSGLIDVKCDAHSWMRAYVYSSKHPYVAITDEKGNFEIKDLLPGKYKIRFWHEGFEEVVKEVEVKAGGSAKVDASFTKKRKPDFMDRL
jgi:hypothetical protein